jgi:hypothetical protein
MFLEEANGRISAPHPGEHGMVTEEMVGVIFVDGQRCEMLVRTEPNNDGAWHNVLVFRRDGRMMGKEVFLTGVPWHLPPEEAAERAVQLNDAERLEMFWRAARPRTPLI